MHYDAIPKAVSALNDCALHADRWPAALDCLVTATDSRAALILPIHGRTPGQLKTSGAEELEAAYFSGGWHKRDLRERGIAKMWADGITVDQDFTSADEMRRNPYYTAFLERLGFRFFAGLGVRLDDHEWVVTLQRHKDAGPFVEDEQRALRLIQAQLQKTAQLESMLATSYASGTLDALHREGSACLMLDGRGQVVFMNEHAERLVGRFFDLRNGRIRLASRQQEKALEAYVASHLGGRLPAPAARHIPDDPDRPQLVFEAFGLPRLETPFSRFALALRVRRLATSIAVAPETLRPIFNLSSREAALLSGKGVSYSQMYLFFL